MCAEGYEVKQLLFISKKKVFFVNDRKILIPYDGPDGEELNDWVFKQYNMSVVRTQPIAKTDIVALSVIEKQHCAWGEYISIAKAIDLIGRDNEPLYNYLNSLRAELDIQLEYGVKDGKIISIMDIPVENKGLQCECVCPGCGGKLVARKGAKKKHHFAHYNEPCNLAVAQQTALHMLAKEIIEQEKTFMFPGYAISYKEINWKPDYSSYNYHPEPELQYRKPCKARCETVALEKKVSDFVPDIIVEVKGKACLIEIAVTHFVDEEKQKKIEATGLPLVEVDLSSLHGQMLSRDVIRDVLVNQTSGKTWIYNPIREEALAWAESEFQRRYEASVETEDKRQEERKQQEEQSRQKRKKAAVEVEKLLQPDNYKKALLNLRSDEAFGTALRNLSFQKDLADRFPFFMDIPIMGEMVLACDRRIWQTAIFDKFIYNRTKDPDGHTRYNNEKIHSYIKKYMPFIKINWDLAYKVKVDLGNSKRELTLLFDVIERYIWYLAYIGFLEEDGYRTGTVARTHSLIPPKEKEAKLLENAIKSSDNYSPFIDDEIKATLYPLKTSYGGYGYIEDGESSMQDQPIYDSTLKGIERRQNAEREIGYNDAQKHNFEGGEPFFDRFGKRWVKCKYCIQIKCGDEMKLYGGKDSENIGVCNECYEKRGRRL